MLFIRHVDSSTTCILTHLLPYHFKTACLTFYSAYDQPFNVQLRPRLIDHRQLASVQFSRATAIKVITLIVPTRMNSETNNHHHVTLLTSSSIHPSTLMDHVFLILTQSHRQHTLLLWLYHSFSTSSPHLSVSSGDSFCKLAYRPCNRGSAANSSKRRCITRTRNHTRHNGLQESESPKLHDEIQLHTSSLSIGTILLLLKWY